ncbi:lariat debranching enzyme-like isoform X2 [Dysidea avara]|uniref:lariat debranching enzyme-like isoform X2 n=1 Tax=Dysidea avara TaxID=196820 RepID=UPI003323E6B2
MKVAVVGCSHGEMDTIYDTILQLEARDNTKVDVLLCCGDFEAIRNEADLSCKACPEKYRKIGTFYKYYIGEKKAPVLTIMIGGNHEASNYMWELGYGGWLAPNIYYLGYSGAVQFGGLRIAGLSGIFVPHDYEWGHFELPPYDQKSIKTVYRVRSFDCYKLKQLRHADIGMSHDWPTRIYHYGNTEEFLQMKPPDYWEQVRMNTLGSPPAEELLTSLRPLHWFSAHLHCRFEASYKHYSSNREVISTTKFLALDKCLPGRHFLEVIDVPHRDDVALELCYDPDWLAITKATANMFPTTKQQWKPPRQLELKNTPEDIEKIRTAFGGSFKIPENFQQTVPCYDPSQPRSRAVAMPTVNPQTQEFCDKLGILNPFVPPGAAGVRGRPDQSGILVDNEVQSSHTPPILPSVDLPLDNINLVDNSEPGTDNQPQPSTDPSS